jgi:predicted  nucleic acid-binding Zn-ribbon protein
MVHDIFNDIFKQHGLVPNTVSLEQQLAQNKADLEALNKQIDKAIADKDLETLNECNKALDWHIERINQLEQQIKELDNVN